jgi:hypothetical protein
MPEIKLTSQNTGREGPSSSPRANQRPESGYPIHHSDLKRPTKSPSCFLIGCCEYIQASCIAQRRSSQACNTQLGDTNMDVAPLSMVLQYLKRLHIALCPKNQFWTACGFDGGFRCTELLRCQPSMLDDAMSGATPPRYRTLRDRRKQPSTKGESGMRSSNGDHWSFGSSDSIMIFGSALHWKVRVYV